MQARVSSTATVAGTRSAAGAEVCALVPGDPASSLALTALRVDPGAQLEVGDDRLDTLVFVHAGSGSAWLDDAQHPLGGACSLHVPAGRRATLAAGPNGLAAVSVALSDDTDLHAPMGAAEAVVDLEHVEPGQATGARSFQVLHGPANGCTRATAFVGYIPPGRAPWHYHLYDEIVWVLRGAGRLHVGDTVEELSAGCAFRLRPREVHIVENTDPVAELVVLGIFTPAGSPSAAYLEPGVAASYTIV